MRVDPDPREPLRPQAGIDLTIEVVSDRLVVEFDGGRSTILAEHLDVVDIEQIVGRRDGKAAHLGRPEIAEKDQLPPGGRTKPQP